MHPACKVYPIPWAPNSTRATLEPTPFPLTLDASETEAIYLAFALIPMVFSVHSQAGTAGSYDLKLDVITRFIQRRCAGGATPASPIHVQVACIVLSQFFGVEHTNAKIKPKFSEIFNTDRMFQPYPTVITAMWQTIRMTCSNLRAYVAETTSFEQALPYLVGIGMAIYRLWTIVRGAPAEAALFNSKLATQAILLTVSTLVGQHIMPTGLPAGFFSQELSMVRKKEWHHERGAPERTTTNETSHVVRVATRGSWTRGRGRGGRGRHH